MDDSQSAENLNMPTDAPLWPTNQQVNNQPNRTSQSMIHQLTSTSQSMIHQQTR